jgi:hypothetical protein
VSGIRRCWVWCQACGVKHTAVSGRDVRERASSTWRCQEAVSDVVLRRRYRARSGVRYGVGVKCAVSEARVSGARRWRSAGIKHAVSDTGQARCRGAVSRRGVRARCRSRGCHQGARCQARGGRGVGVKHAVVSDVSVSDTVLRRGCQARGGIGAQYRGAGIRHTAVSRRGCQARGGRGVEARMSGTWRCQRRSIGARVSGARRCQAWC